MISATLKIFFKSHQDRSLKKAAPIIAQVNSFESSLLLLSQEELANKTIEFQKRLKGGEKLDSIMPEAFAVVRESAKRILGMRHYDVQILGGYFLHQGNITEMKTGEGKTLVATLALYLNALSGKGAHLVTVNDYLAKRDATWMAPLYRSLGLTVGIVQSDNSSFLLEGDALSNFIVTATPASRSAAYAADITYGTNNEFGFDYLRDNMSYSKDQFLQRGHNFAIVDEVDSILIDEARTPLIISGAAPSNPEGYEMANTVAKSFIIGTHYDINEKNKTVKLLDEGINEAQRQLGIDNLYHISSVDRIHYINNALRAHGVYRIDVEYVIENGKVIIVDEFTGRMMPGRRYGEGLHQAVEAKEGIRIESENQTLASITFQNYFRMYDKLAGMTGTALTEAEEFSQIYKLGVISIPTNVPITRKDYVDTIYKTQHAKFNAITYDVLARHQEGRPTLIGTVSIETSEYLSSLLKKQGIPHKVLNAKHHAQEANIIESAGMLGAVTIATNMAGRGTDIKLGEGVLATGGLHIIGTERHESRRIDNQLRGRAGRQGDPGSSRFYLSMEDSLMRIFNGDKIKSLMSALKIPDNEPIENRLISRSIQTSQKKVEAHNFEIRKHLLEYDNINNEQRNVIYSMRKDAIESSSTDYVDAVFQDSLQSTLDDIIGAYTTQGLPNFGDKEWLRERLLMQFSIQLDSEAFASISTSTDLSRIIHESAEKQLASQKDVFGDMFLTVGKDVSLRSIDTKWIAHLQVMSYLRDSVGLRGYGQKDPLIEYKKEAYSMFVEMMQSIDNEFLRLIMSARISNDNSSIGATQGNKKLVTPMRATHKHHGSLLESSKKQIDSGRPAPSTKSNTVRNTEPKIGRNQVCPCGSGKKYKNCHGSLVQ